MLYTPREGPLGTCVVCGKGVCNECAVAVDGRTYCRDCLASGGSFQAPAKNGLAITSMVLGILSFPLAFCYGGGILFGIAAFITGLVARRQIEEGRSQQGGKGIANAGVIMGAITGVLGALLVLIVLVLALLGPAIGDVFSNIVSELQ